MRTLSDAVAAHLAGRAIRPALLAAITLPDASVHRYWSGIGTLTWNGESWTGLGKLGRITGAGETAEIRTVETAYTLMGVTDFDELNVFLATAIRNGTAQAWLAFLNDDETVIPDPVQIDDSILDRANPRFGEDGSAALTLSATSAIFNFAATPGLYITHEEQQREYLGDTGFDRIPGLASRVVAWTPT